MANDPWKFSLESLPNRGLSVPLNINKCSKNLGHFEDEEVPTIAHVKVYLRIKPLDEPRADQLGTTMHIENDHTLLTHSSDGRMPTKPMKSIASGPNCFKFSKIFGPRTSQKEVFDGTVFPLVQDIFNGVDSLLFAYGTSSAGKTYTIQGSEKHPGVIPRALDALFNSLKDKIMKEIKYKPHNSDSVMALTDEMAKAEYNLKDSILRWNPESIMEGSQYLKSVILDKTMSTRCSSISDYSRAGSGSYGCSELLAPEDEEGVKYSVWVSFAEVYNENVYDLLDFIPSRAYANVKRPTLTLSTDANGITQIKGLREVCVFTGDEACQVMLLGKCNLHFAATKLNHKSSRSHCIFTVKLLRIPPEETGAFRWNTLSFCDLAGSERAEKSGITGDRLKETGNINTSLLVLGRCLKALRYNQSDNKNAMRVPFRESKLTRIFQNALTGNGNVAMIVNVNQSPLLLEETLNVLKYAAVAQQIVLVPVEPPKKKNTKPKTRFSVFAEKQKLRPPVPSFAMDSVVEDVASSNVSTGDCTFMSREIDNLQDEVQSLRAQLEETESTWRKKESRIRREICSNYNKMLKASNERRLKEVSEVRSEVAEYYLALIELQKAEYEEKVESLKENLQSEQSTEPVEKVVEEDMEQMESKIKSLTLENVEMKKQLDKLRSDNEELKDDFESKVHRMSMDMVTDSVKMMSVEDNEAMERLEKENSDLKLKLKDLKIDNLEMSKLLKEGSQDYLAEMNKVSALEEELMKKNSKIAELEMKISDLNEELGDVDMLIEGMNSDLENKEETIAELEKLLKEKEGVIQTEKSIQNDLMEHKSKLEKSVTELEEKLRNREAYYSNIIEEKESEINELQKSYKTILNDKNSLEQRLEAEKFELESKVFSLKVRLEEMNSTPKEAIKMVDVEVATEVSKETEQMLGILKEELEAKRMDNTKLLNEVQSLRDVVDCKEKEMKSFQDHQVKILSQYEALLNKSKEDVDVHRREEMRLRSLLQFGTPNKYEKTCQSLNVELSQLKRKMRTVLCRECSAKLPLEERMHHSLQERRADVSNENLDPRIRSLRRKSKSQSYLDHISDSDDSDFIMEKENHRRRKQNIGLSKTFTGHDMNHDSSDFLDPTPQGEERTPFKSSRRLLNPSHTPSLLSFRGSVPEFPRTPGDVIKRVLRPRRK